MDAVEFIKERNRMCKSFSPDCEGCRIDEVKPVVSECVLWALDNPEKAVQIVEEWAAAHPRKTRQSVFLEQYPQASIGGDGVLRVCPFLISESHRNAQGACVNINRQCSDCRKEYWLKEVE